MTKIARRPASACASAFARITPAGGGACAGSARTKMPLNAPAAIPKNLVTLLS